MRHDKKDKDFAKRLVSLSVTDGQVSPERVSAVLEALRLKPVRRMKALLKLYYRLLRNELRLGQAQVEYAGEVDESALSGLAAHFTALYGRPIVVESRENPALIAGVRVRVGDDVYDTSVAGRLDELASHVQ